MIAGFKNYTPFLTSAYPTGLWAFSEAPVSPDTREKIVDAHASALRFNHRESHGRGVDDAWQLAKKNIPVAVEAIQADDALLTYVQWPTYPEQAEPVE